MSRAYLLCFLALPLFLPAQTLPPAFQNVFPSPFRESKAQEVKVWPAVRKTVVTPNAMPERLCAGPMPSAQLDTKTRSDMPIRRGSHGADSGMAVWVKPCYPSPERQ